MRERRHELGVTVARDDLARGLGGAQTELRAHLLLDARIDLRVRADRPADRADAHGLARPPQPVAVPVELERPERDLVAEAGRLGDDAVGAAGHHDVAVAERQALGDRQQALEGAEQEVARVAELQSEPRVQHVGRSQAEVHPASGRSDRVRDDLHERGHVVLGDALDLRDAIAVERRLRPDLARIGVGDHAEPGERLGDEDLDLEPVPQPGLVGPDGAHLREDVPLDHCSGWTGSRPVTGGGPPRGRP